MKTNKNDAADAEAICEAVTRPNMHFVPIKSTVQQAILSLHRIRQGYVKARTAQANQIRGLLAEFGLEIPQGIGYIEKRVPDIIEDASNELTGILRIEIQSLLEHLPPTGGRLNPPSEKTQKSTCVGWTVTQEPTGACAIKR